MCRCSYASRSSNAEGKCAVFVEYDMTAFFHERMQIFVLPALHGFCIMRCLFTLLFFTGLNENLFHLEVGLDLGTLIGLLNNYFDCSLAWHNNLKTL